MRLAHEVWLGIAAVVFVLVAAHDLAGTSRTPAPASSSSHAGPSATTTTTRSVPTYAAAPATTTRTPTGELVTVTDVVDGDTIEVSGERRVRLLGIDACEMDTRGGREARDLLETFVEGDQVRLVAEGTRDRDGYDRLLRRVETSTGDTDVGGLMVVYPTVTVYEGRNDATPAYLSELRSRDDGERDCSGTPAVTDTTDSPDVDIDVDLGDDGDDGLPDGALTGGYCARKWWC